MTHTFVFSDRLVQLEQLLDRLDDVCLSVCLYVCLCVSVCLQVLVSHVDTDDSYVRVCLQPSDRLVQLEQLLDRLDDVYSADDTIMTSYRRGDAVAVCVATIWQRATVVCDAVSAVSTVKVQCVDYGSVHDVDVSKVRRLNADLMSEPMFAFDCELFGVTADDGTIRFCSLVMFELNGTLY